MPETPNKPSRRRKAKTASDVISTENVADQTAAEKYKASEPKQYQPPDYMVPLNDDRYKKTDRIGTKKAIRAPGQTVTRVGLGGLNVLHQNPTNYHGDLDV